jgi:hypothetical protein
MMTARPNPNARDAPALRTDLLLALFLIGLCVAACLLPHVSNFSPVAAAALFAGAMIGQRSLALLVPVAALLIGDLTFGFYDWRVMAVVYAALALPAVIGMIARTHRIWFTAIGGAVAASLIFFVTTNFAVWAFGGLYSLDSTGLIQCYIAALPFLKYTVAGDLFWSVALFGGASLLRTTAGQRQQLPVRPRT